MDKKLLNILACPLCKGKLDYQQEHQQLICHFDKLAYPIENDIPIMLVDKANKISAKEK